MAAFGAEVDVSIFGESDIAQLFDAVVADLQLEGVPLAQGLEDKRGALEEAAARRMEGEGLELHIPDDAGERGL